MKYIVCGELTNKQYIKLREFALEYSDLFSVSTFKVHKKDLLPTYFEFFESMSSFEADKYSCVLPQHYERGQNFRVFKLSDTAKQYIINCRSFWDWSLPKLPEDISFYRSKKVWLNCITHEKMILIESNDEALLRFLNGIGLELRSV